MRRQLAHVLVLPFPAQGHVAPLLKLARSISDHGVKVTFVNSHFVHAQLLTASAAALPPEADADAVGKARNPVQMVSIPDGLGPEDDRSRFIEMEETISVALSSHLKELIEKINNSSDDEKITCVIVDTTVAWALKDAESMGIKTVAFCPCGPAVLALAFHVPRLLQSGILNPADGSFSEAGESIRLAKDIPAFTGEVLPWNSPSNPTTREFLFRMCSRGTQDNVNHPDWILCNCVQELDSSVCELIPNFLPIGPLLGTNHGGSFWPEDSTSVAWLHTQPAASVVYVAFGSLTVLKQPQFNELALGLELAGRPFLWVVRPDFAGGSAAEFPDGFMERVAGFGKIVSWAPQEEVLAHPSVACFLSHCGWNSTMDGIAMGVPFLCWPYFADQFHNQRNICEKWKVGLEIKGDDENAGFVSRHEIRKKIQELVSDEGIKENAEKLKKMARNSVSTESGSSYKNFKTFIDSIKH